MTRSTFRSQNVQNTPRSDQFWKLRCPKSAHRCGAKHISKSKCTKHTTFGPLLEVAMSKKCTPLWREAHFEVKMYKTPHVRANFGGSDVVRLAGARDCAPCQKRAKREGFVAFSTTTTTTPHYTPRQYTTTTTTPSLHSTTLHCTQLHSITLHYATLHYTTLLHYTITLHYYTTLLHYTTLPSTFHYTSLYYTTLRSTTLQLQLQLQLHNYTPPH